MRERGVTLADWTPGGYDTPFARKATDEISAAGANTIVLVVTFYQESLSADNVYADPARTPSTPALEAAIGYARSKGLRVVVKPHIDVDTGEWRGLIGPSDRRQWFASYAELIVPLADWAENMGVSGLVAGTELGVLSSEEAQWRSLISRIRSVFSGRVHYAASWDESDGVPFWDAVDAVSVDFYLPVAERRDPSRFEILSRWQIWLERLHRLHAQTGRSVILTEVGYRSVDGAGLKPYLFGDESREDAAEQADLYWAALEAVGSEQWMEGMWWWNWLASGDGGAGNKDYTPSGKPAEGVLSDAWNR